MDREIAAQFKMYNMERNSRVHFVLSSVSLKLLQELEYAYKLLHSLTKSLSLLDLLHVNDRDKGKDSISNAPCLLLYGDLFRASYCIPAYLKREKSETFSWTLWTPSDPKYEGIDALHSLKNESGEEAVFGFQYNWSRLMSKDESTNNKSLDCDTVVKAIFNTCKHHRKELSQYISTPSSYHTILQATVNNLCSAHEKEAVEALAVASVAEDKEKYRLQFEASKELSVLVDAVTKNILIFGKDHMEKLLTPSLNRRLAT